MTRKVFAYAAAIIAVLAVAGYSQQLMDTAYVTVIVNQSATVTFETPTDAPAGARVPSASSNVQMTANQARTLALILGPAANVSASHLPQGRAAVSASVIPGRSGVSIIMPPQQYANAEISLHSMNGRRVLRANVSASRGDVSVSRANVAPGVYLLSVKGTAGSAVTARLPHNGGRLNINAVFENAAQPAPMLGKADAVAGAWTVIAVSAGNANVSQTFNPVKGRDNDTLRLTFQTIVPLGDTTDINLQGSTASAVGRNAASVIINQDNNYGTVIEIDDDGIYRVQGTLTNGFIAVSKRDLWPTIILNGANITSQRYGALVSLKKSDVDLVLAAGTTNVLRDANASGSSSDGKYNGGANSYDPEEQPNATLNVRDNLTISGSGSLTITAGLNNGIGSRANLRIESGNITVTAPNNALRGNDGIVITGGTLNITSGNDGIQTEGHETDNTRGDISITGGNITIQADRDGVQSARNLTIENATINVTSGLTGSGSNIRRGSDAGIINACDISSKGLKAVKDILIKSGTITVSSRDDGIHADGTLTINNGTITVATAAEANGRKPACNGQPAGSSQSGYGGDALRGAGHLTINGGDINITKSSEGIEAFNVTINDGNIRVIATDDAINAGDTAIAGCPTQYMCCLISGAITINGGTIYAQAGNDAIDSNGDLKITGGTIAAFGPGGAQSVQEAIDVDGSFTITGGTLIAVGVDGGNMQKAPTANGTTQRVVYVRLCGGGSIWGGGGNCTNGEIAANTIVNITSNGNQVMTFRTHEQRTATRLVITSPLIANGPFEIRTGGSHSGTMNSLRMFTGGSYSGGSLLNVGNINVSGMVTTHNQQGAQGIGTVNCRPLQTR